MNTRGHRLGLLLALWAGTTTAHAQVKLADRAYSLTGGPECVGVGTIGCEAFPVAMQVTGPTPLVLRETHDLSAPIVARVGPNTQVTKINNVRLHFYTHGGVVLRAGPGLAVGDRVYPSAWSGVDSYPFADWEDPDDDHYEVQVVALARDDFGIGVYFKKPDAPLIEWKQLQPNPTDEHWMQLQLADGSKGWVGPCTFDQAYTCDGSRVAYVRSEDTEQGRRARAEAWLQENPEYAPDEGDGDEGSGLPPPEFKPGDPRMLHVLRGGTIRSAAFSPDGRQIITASDDGVVRVWTSGDGKQVASFAAPGGIASSASFSPDGRQIVTTNGDAMASVWTSDGRPLLTLSGNASGLFSAEFSHDGKRILTTGGDNIARIWDAATGRQLQALTSTASAINFAAFLPDGARVATGSHDAYTTEVWDVASGRLLETLETGGLGSGIALSPDSKRIASIGWDTVTVHDLATGKKMFAFSIGTRHVALSSIAYSPDGKRIITGEEMGYARVWDATDGAMLFGLNPYDPNSPLSRPGPARPIEHVAMSVDGSRILTVGRGAAHIWGAN